MSHTNNPRTVEAEAEGSHVQNRPGLYKEDPDSLQHEC